MWKVEISRRLRPGVLHLAVLGALALSAPGGGEETSGTEFQVNTYTSGAQDFAAVATDAGGNFVVVWQSDGQDGDEEGIFGRRFDGDGNPLGSEFQVNTYTTGSQREPAIAIDADGDFVVVWSSAGQDGSGEGIFGQRFEASGVPLGAEFQVNTLTTFSQRDATIAMDGDGNFVVAWTAPHLFDFDVAARRYEASGTPAGGEFQVNTYTTFWQYDPAVAADAVGNFLVVWTGYGAGDSVGIFGRRYDTSGSPLGGEFRVNTFTLFEQSRPAVASDAAGNFVVVWDGYNSGSFFFGGIEGQRFDTSGAPLGEEFEISASGYGSYGRRAAVAAGTSGGFVVSWDEVSAYGAGDPTIYAREFSASGAPRGGWFRVDSHTEDTERSSVASDGEGNFIVTWANDGRDGDDAGVFGERFPASSLELAIAGSCPGSVSVTINGASPNAEVGVVAAATDNGWTKGGLHCNGTVFEIGEPFHLPPTWINVDGNGNGAGSMLLPPDRCWVQAVAPSKCETSNVVFVQ